MPSLSLGVRSGGLHRNLMDIRSRVANYASSQVSPPFTHHHNSSWGVDMRFSTASSVIALSALTAVSQAEAEDALYSRRIAKRDIDADGNYNICQSRIGFVKSSTDLDIAFFHVNDVHAHLDEFSSSGTDCTRPERGCYGGYARIKTIVEERRPNYNDSLWLNVGDEFQGTLFYSFYGGEKIAETLNQMNFSAMTIGNHEVYFLPRIHANEIGINKYAVRWW